MTTATLVRPKPTRKKVQEGIALKAWEYIACCPHCKTIETVWLTENGLVQTRKFNQADALVYHDCGAKEPCRLLPRFLKSGPPAFAHAAVE